MKVTFCIFIMLMASSEAKRGCPDMPAIGNWTCEDHDYFMQQKSIENTLHCLGYNNLIGPNQSGLTLFYVKRSIQKLLEINENGMQIVYEESFIEAFNESRLNFEELQQCENVQSYTGIYPFWFPKEVSLPSKEKLEFVTGKIKDYPMSTLDSKGQVHVVSKAIVTLHCEFDFTWFPFDVQYCTNNLELRNFEGFNVKLRRFSQVDIKEYQWAFENDKPSIHHPSWDIDVLFINEEPHNTTNSQGEVVQTMKLTLMMKRHTSEHVLHTLVPSLMLCVASSMSLFIPYDLYAARMSLSGTTCLSMITLFTGAKDSWPVNSIAMRAWVILCYITVFCTLIEYCLALSLIKNGTSSFNKVNSKNGTGGNNDSAMTYRKAGLFLEEASKILVPMYLILFTSSFFLLCMNQRSE